MNKTYESINRTLKETITKHTFRHRKSILLLGPRQVGKSTLMRSLNPNLIIDLSDESAFRSHLKDVGLFRRMVQAQRKGSLILVDETQRIPSLLNTIQALIDEKKDWIFLLTGSSARKLKRGQANLLPGRLFVFNLFPLTYWEQGKHFDLERSLTIGDLPEISLTEYGPDLIQNYIDTYLKEEIQAEALTRNIGSYSRFLDLAAESSGQIINYSQLSSDSEIPKETLRRYYGILQDTLLVHQISGFTKVKSTRKALQRDKFVLFDVGVKNAILRQHKNQFTDTQKGMLFEQWLTLQIIALSSYKGWNWQFYYYRDQQQNEVDLVIDCGSEIKAIEIKYSRTIKDKFLIGLQTFEKVSKKKSKSYLIYCGSEIQKEGSIEILPYQEFLKQLIE